VLLIDLQVVSQAASRLFQVGSRLVDGQGKLAQGQDNRAGILPFLLRSITLAACPAQQELDALRQRQRVHFQRRGQGTHRAGSRGEQDAALALDGQIGREKCSIISVVIDQQPGLRTVLQPAQGFAGQSVLIAFLLGPNRRHPFFEGGKAGQDGFFAGGTDPEGMGEASLLARPIGVFDGGLRFADATEPLNGLRLGQGGMVDGRGLVCWSSSKLPLQLGEQLVTPGKMGIAGIRHCPERQRLGGSRAALPGARGRLARAPAGEGEDRRSSSWSHHSSSSTFWCAARQSSRICSSSRPAAKAAARTPRAMKALRCSALGLVSPCSQFSTALLETPRSVARPCWVSPMVVRRVTKVLANS